MKTEATLLREIAAATTLREQASLMAELDSVRATAARQVQQDRDLDFTAAVIDQTLSPVLTHSMHTASTDWLDEVAAPPLDTNRVIAEAALWFGKTSSMVREDAEEFSEQARGQARRVAGAYGERAPEAERAYLDYVAFLHRREGASGLDQIQQLIDGNNQPKRTNLPEDVFDTFEDAVAPENQGVDEMQSSYNAPLLNEIIQNGQGEGQAEVLVQHGPGSGPSQPANGGSGMNVGASLVDPVSPAVSHLYNLDEFKAAQRAEAALHAQATKESDSRGEDGKCLNCVNGNHSGTNGTPGCRGRGCTCSNSNCGKVRPMKTYEKKSSVEAASQLPQVQQVVDSFENPDPKPLPQDVMFPLIPYFQGEQGNTKESARDPRLSDPASRRPFVRTADQFGTSAEQAQTVGDNNPELGKTHNGGVQQADEPSNAMEKATAAKDFERAYSFARAWKPGDRIVTKGSVEFEAGLYAGMAENAPKAQQAWLDAHTKWATKDPYLDTRIGVHAAYTASLRSQSGTTTDLETMEPGLNNAHPDGTTPLNGPGTVPPMAGGVDPARPGGAAPYNGAEPFSAPVAPDPGWTNPHARMSAAQRTEAFKATVAARLAAAEPKNTPVCRGCGEAFESRQVAEQAHGKTGCGTEPGERGYEMKRESEAW